MFGFFGHGYASAASGIYIGLFLMRLSFLSPPKRPDLYVVHVIHSSNSDESSSSSEKKSEESGSESQKSPVV
ncbi:hypothetical protein CAEBREN_25751 [Caenorhabditis brenneri]|uniref:Uncharacterized protein n=1 Tax=Caenorhabditis brenneri TaxID=135651 RepID=G0NK52_CAEBE|nr:hypothetical protein CAEBREN_25751 [Caenorhabditis brenneri]